MTDKDDGGPAFPIMLSGNSEGHTTDFQSWPGMTLRQWYAGKALQGLVSSITSFGPRTPENTADLAFKFADAMIAAEKDMG